MNTTKTLLVGSTGDREEEGDISTLTAGVAIRGNDFRCASFTCHLIQEQMRTQANANRVGRVIKLPKVQPTSPTVYAAHNIRI